MRYPVQTIRYVQHLRILGNTYREIQEITGQKFAKATLCGWCKHLPLPPELREKVKQCNIRSWAKARRVSLGNRRRRHAEFIKQITITNTPLSKRIGDREIATIALAMLCLGEASKSTSRSSSFSLGNSDPRIITLFLEWLKECFPFDASRLRCRLQCRADQDIKNLERFWATHTGVPESQFYPTYIDKRTFGKPTLKKEYKGVLSVIYLRGLPR